MKYIDTHGHLNSIEFLDDLSLYIEEAKKLGVDKIVIPGTSKEDSLQAIDIASKFDNTFAMVALHPTSGYKLEDIDWLGEIDGSKLVGVGECGVDLYREGNPPAEIQQEIFRKHLRFALKWDLPVAIHTRDAEQETIDVLKESEFKNIRFIIHCSTVSKDWALKFIELGGYISFSGIVTFKNAHEIKEAMMAAPLDRILTETDSPYLAPVPMRGKMNQPAYVKYVTDYIADARPEDRETIINQIYKNAHKVFSI